MKNKTNLFTISILYIGVLLFLVYSCKKEENPVLITTEISDITDSSANSGGSITFNSEEIIFSRGVCWSTTQTPTILNEKTTDGTGVGNFESSIRGLSPNTTYFVRSYATNSIGTFYGNVISFTTQEDSSNTFTDLRDGNIYNIVTIGSQVWMKENLRYLPNVVGPAVGSLTIPLYYVYGYDGTSVIEAKTNSNYHTYGVLYNWIAAMNGETSSESNPSGVQGICPTGWHLPSSDEILQLGNSVGGIYIAGGKLKEMGTIHWSDPNIGATNESGFTALPSGYRWVKNEYFVNMKYEAPFWTTTDIDVEFARVYIVVYDHDAIIMPVYNKEWGMSVRCIKD